MTGIDRELLRDLDRHLRSQDGVAPPTAPETHMAPPPRADISGVLEAIQFAASSMNATADCLEQLEAHSRACEEANKELEAQNEHLTVQLGNAIQERDATAASLEAEKERLQRLEGLAAQHVSRANALDRELAASQADLARVIELVRTSFGQPPDEAFSTPPEDPTPTSRSASAVNRALTVGFAAGGVDAAGSPDTARRQAALQRMEHRSS